MLTTCIDGTPEYAHTDHLGTVQVATTTAGLMRPQAYYTPYGEAMDTPTQAAARPELDLGLTGHLRDKSTGLTYMQARYHDPTVGRFLSVDPVTFMETRDPRYVNRYMYAGNDSPNAVDPDGKQIVENGSVKFTMSAGVSSSANYGDKGSHGASEIAIEFGIGIPNENRGKPIPFTAGIVTVDGKAKLNTRSIDGSESGIAADLDILEDGISLGSISDRAGVSSAIKVDAGVPGLEISAPGGIAGATVKISAGIGVAVATSDQIVEVEGEERFDKR